MEQKPEYKEIFKVIENLSVFNVVSLETLNKNLPENLKNFLNDGIKYYKETEELEEEIQKEDSILYYHLTGVNPDFLGRFSFPGDINY